MIIFLVPKNSLTLNYVITYFSNSISYFIFHIFIITLASTFQPHKLNCSIVRIAVKVESDAC